MGSDPNWMIKIGDLSYVTVKAFARDQPQIWAAKDTSSSCSSWKKQTPIRRGGDGKKKK